MSEEKGKARDFMSEFKNTTINEDLKNKKTKSANAENIINNSGQGANSVVYDIIAKDFNWGAFFFNWIWGVCNNTYIPLLIFPLALLAFIPIIGLIVPLGFCIWLGLKGNEWAWQNKRWASIEKFHSVQKKWAIGVVITCVVLPLIICLVIVIAGVSLFTVGTNIMEKEIDSAVKNGENIRIEARGSYKKEPGKKAVSDYNRVTVKESSKGVKTVKVYNSSSSSPSSHKVENEITPWQKISNIRWDISNIVFFTEDKLDCGLSTEEIVDCINESTFFSKVSNDVLKYKDKYNVKVYSNNSCKRKGACFITITDDKLVNEKCPMYIKEDGNLAIDCDKVIQKYEGKDAIRSVKFFSQNKVLAEKCTTNVETFTDCFDNKVFFTEKKSANSVLHETAGKTALLSFTVKNNCKNKGYCSVNFTNDAVELNETLPMFINDAGYIEIDDSKYVEMYRQY